MDGEGKDIQPGEKLVACVRPFLEALAASDLSPKTIQKHVDNLRALDGEIIRTLNETPSLRRKSIKDILDDRIDDGGGPLAYALESEELQQRSLDSTCRKLYLFLRQHPHRTGSITHKFPRRGELRKLLSGAVSRYASFCQP